MNSPAQTSPLPDGFSCRTCGKRHTFNAWNYTHWATPVSQRCDLCGAVHSLLRGVAWLTLPGLVPPKTTQFELDIAAGVTLATPPEEPQLTNWITAPPPVREGYYHIRFPNGTEADRNWWWSVVRQSFLYDGPTGVAAIGFAAIGAYRGLDRQYP